MATFDYRKFLKENKSTFHASLTEGQFSWMTQDTEQQIGSEKENTIDVYMFDNTGKYWFEKAYDGYGEFGGKDYYDLVAEMNGYTADDAEEFGGTFKELRGIGIKLAFGELEPKNGGPVLFPALVADPKSFNYKTHNFTKEAETDPNQSWYTSEYEDEDDYEEEEYGYDEDYDEDELDEGAVAEGEEDVTSIGKKVEAAVEDKLETTVSKLSDEQKDQLKAELSKLGITANSNVKDVAAKLNESLYEAEGDTKAKVASALQDIGGGLIKSLLVPIIPVAIGSLGPGVAAGFAITAGVAGGLIALAKLLGAEKSMEEGKKEYYKDAEADDAEHIKALEKDMEDDKKSSKMKVSELKSKIKEMILAELEIGDMEDAPESEVDFLAELEAMLNEADEETETETEEEVDIDVEDPEPKEEPVAKGGIDVDQNAVADLTGVEKEVQDNLEAAMEAAKKLNDEKLQQQIGNSLTFFTRQHVVKEDLNEDKNLTESKYKKGDMLQTYGGEEEVTVIDIKSNLAAALADTENPKAVRLLKQNLRRNLIDDEDKNKPFYLVTSNSFPEDMYYVESELKSSINEVMFPMLKKILK